MSYFTYSQDSGEKLEIPTFQHNFRRDKYFQYWRRNYLRYNYLKTSIFPIFRLGKVLNICTILLCLILIDRSYQCATQDDLWEALTTQAHRDGVLDKTVTVKQIMDTWTLQTGFPVVTVVRDYNNSSSNGRITVSQVSVKISLIRINLNVFQNTSPRAWYI